MSLTCYQQAYTPGISNTGGLLTNPGLANQQQQQQYQNYGQLALPTITCSTTATACYKFVCFGASKRFLKKNQNLIETILAPYTIKGCLDYTQPAYSCQAMDAQCLGGQGSCYVCNGNAGVNKTCKNTVHIVYIKKFLYLRYFVY